MKSSGFEFLLSKIHHHQKRKTHPSEDLLLLMNITLQFLATGNPIVRVLQIYIKVRKKHPLENRQKYKFK